MCFSKKTDIVLNRTERNGIAHPTASVLLFHTGITGANRQYPQAIQYKQKSDCLWVPVLTKYRYLYIILEKGILPYWRQGIYDQLLSGIGDSLSNIFSFQNKLVNSWTYQLYHYAFLSLKVTQFKIDAFLREGLTMAHWIRLSLLCRCKWTRKSQVSGEKMPQNNIYFLWA